VALSRPIKELGLHTVHVNLHPEVDVDIVLNVARSPEEAELQASGKSIQELAAEEEAAAEFEIAELFDDIGAAQLDDSTMPGRPPRHPKPRQPPRTTRKTDLPVDPPRSRNANRWAVSLAGMRPIFFLRRHDHRGRHAKPFPVHRRRYTAYAHRPGGPCPTRFRRGAEPPRHPPAFAGQTEAPERVSSFVADPVLVAGGLEHPWAVAVLPDGAGFLVTERPGRLRHITREGVVSAPIGGMPEVFDVSQGGLSRRRACAGFP
jgi:hypothetical protein